MWVLLLLGFVSHLWVFLFICEIFLVSISVILLDWCGFDFAEFCWSFVGFVLVVVGDG